MSCTDKIEKGREIDISSIEAKGFTVGLDLTQGHQRPIVIVGLHQDGNMSIHMDLSQAKETVSALVWLIEKVESEKLI